MDNVAPDCGALFESVIFLNHFKGMPDHRQRGKVMYPLNEVLGATIFLLDQFGYSKPGCMTTIASIVDLLKLASEAPERAGVWKVARGKQLTLND